MAKKSSGSYKRHDGFNPIQIKNGLVVRIGKDSKIRQVLGKYGEYKGSKAQWMIHIMRFWINKKETR